MTIRYCPLLLSLLVASVTFVSEADILSPSLKSFLKERVRHSNQKQVTDSAGLSIQLTDQLNKKQDFEVIAVDEDLNVSRIICPVDDAENFLKEKGFIYATLPAKRALHLNHTRAITKTDLVLPGQKHAPDILPYTGKGVVVGLVDAGIDPTHPTFLTSDRSRSRVVEYINTMSAAESDSGNLEARHFTDMALVTDADIDKSSDGHGTHTSSTAAGAWNGNDLFGCAPDADLFLVTTGGEIYDDEILYGMNKIADYARDNNKRAVMNFSLGSTLGPHDGTGIFSLGAEAATADGNSIIFASSGNDGTHNLSMCVDFSQEPDPVHSLLYCWGARPHWYIDMEAWSYDTKEAEISIVLVTNDSEHRILYESPYLKRSQIDEAGGVLTLLADTSDGNSSYLPELEQYFQGKLQLSMQNYAPNGRFYISLSGIVRDWTEQMPIIGFGLKSPQGAEMRIFTSGTSMLGTGGVPGYHRGSPAESISDMSIGKGVISVGSTNSSLDSFTNLDGHTYSLLTDFPVYGQPDDYTLTSSYGTSFDEKREVLPQILAPGTFIMAAYNRFATSMKDYRIAQADYEGKTQYWGQMSGTSMSSPAVTGIIALWLEANPNLTRDQILETLEATSNPRDFKERYGQVVNYGLIDAYDGLKHVIALNSVAEINVDSEAKLMIRFLGGNRLECTLGACTAEGSVYLTLPDGRRVSLQKVSGSSFNMELPSVTGFAILTVETNKGPVSQKIMLR